MQAKRFAFIVIFAWGVSIAGAGVSYGDRWGDDATPKDSQKTEESSGPDECQKSVDALGGSKGHCDPTYQTIKNATMTNVLGQTLGAVAVGAAGTVGQMKASQEGTQSAAYSAAASGYKTQATASLGLGAANLAFAYKQHQFTGDHKKNRSEIFQKMEAEKKLAAQQGRPPNPDLVKEYNKAMGEQTKAEKAADAGSFQSMVVGAQQLVNGLTGMAAAGQMEAAAKKVKRMEGISFSVRPMTPGQLTAGDVLAPRTATAIGGNGQADTTNAVDEQKTEDLADLGAPVPDGLSPEGLQNAAPTAQKFVGKDPGDAKGGGGPASMSVGSTSANTGAGETPSGPTAASNAGSTAYQGGAGGGYQGGGGGGAAGGKDPDLSSMLAQFLPKKEDEVGQNGILDYGGRSPASDESASLLDRNANIFERIHQTYQSKQKAKSVGI